MSYLATVPVPCAVAHSVQRCNGKSHDSRRIFSKSFYTHCVLRRKIQPCLYGTPANESKWQWPQGISKLLGHMRAGDYCTHIIFGMQFDQEALAFEWYFANLRPREGIDPRNALKDGNTHVSNGQIQRHTIVVFGWVHLHAVQLASSRSF